MKKVIFTLFVCLSCIMMANAQPALPVVDTLPVRIVNGLEVIPIRTTYKSGEIFWKLRASDFKKCFQNFESRYPGGFNYNLISRKKVNFIFDWQDHIWATIVPADIKALEGIDIRIFIDKEGHLFTAEFLMWNDVFEKLNTLPQSTLKNLYHNLIKEKCKVFKDIEYQTLNENYEFDRQRLFSVCGSVGTGKEYVTIELSWYLYNSYGTFNSNKVLKMPREKVEKMRERMQEKRQGKDE